MSAGRGVLAVVGRVDDPGVVELTQPFQLGKKVANPLVDQRDHRLVLAGTGEYELVGE